jgi:hypothetical protein
MPLACCALSLSSPLVALSTASSLPWCSIQKSRRRYARKSTQLLVTALLSFQIRQTCHISALRSKSASDGAHQFLSVRYSNLHLNLNLTNKVSGVPRLLEEDDTYNGYWLPKGAVIHAVDLAIARNPELYPDAETYNPDRWLSPEFPTYKEPLTEHPRLMGHHGFGMGRRMCPGIEVTEAELLVACSALCWGFNMKPNMDKNGQPIWPDSNKFTANLIGGPLPFDFDLQVRDEKRATMIREMYEESLLAEAAGRLG